MTTVSSAAYRSWVEEGASGARAAMLYAPPANCRIREVHCGSQVRLVVIAIRDIAKGEEITVDYSLTEWGENAMVTVAEISDALHTLITGTPVDCQHSCSISELQIEEPGNFASPILECSGY